MIPVSHHEEHKTL